MSGRKRIKRILIFLLAAGLTASLAVSGAFAYILQQFDRLTGNYTDEERLKVEVVYPDNAADTERTYMIIPGERQAFSPRIAVSSQVDAYIFAEITDTIGEGLIEYSVADGWIALPPYYNGQFKRVRPYYRLVGKDDEQKMFDLIKNNEITYSPRITAENISTVTNIDRFIGIKAQGIEYDPFSGEDSTPEDAYAYLKFDNSVIAADVYDLTDADIAVDSQTGRNTLAQPLEMTAYSADGSAVLAKAILPAGTVLDGSAADQLQFVVRIDDDCNNLDTALFSFDVGIYGISEDNGQPISFELYYLPNDMTAAQASYRDTALTDEGSEYSGEAGTYAFDGSEFDFAADDVTPAWKLPVDEIEPYEKFETIFPSTDRYIYRVGNLNDAKLQYLFDEIENAEIDGENVSVTIENLEGSAAGSFVPAGNDVWKDGRVSFSGSGIVRVTITDCTEECLPTELLLEVVDGANVTDYQQLVSNRNKNAVMLDDISMSPNTRIEFRNSTLFGNGYTFDVTAGIYTGTIVTDDYLVGLNNAILDNVNVKGAVYQDYGTTASSSYYNACVLTQGNSKILNSCISNCAAAVRVYSGTLKIDNSTIRGGVLANIDIRSGSLYLHDVITVNQASDNDPYNSSGNTKTGLGILAYSEGNKDNSRIDISGTFTQYNYLARNDEVSSFASSFRSIVFGSSYSDYYFSYGGTEYINTGIVSASPDLDYNDIICSGTVLNAAGTNGLDGYRGKNVSLLGNNGYAYLPLKVSAPLTAPAYESTRQGDIEPAYTIEYPLPDQKNYRYESADDSCMYSASEDVIKINYPTDGSFTFDTDIFTVSKNGNDLPVTVKLDGVVQTGNSIVFSGEDADHILSFTYTDPYNYSYDAQQGYTDHSVEYTKTVKIHTHEAAAEVKDTVFRFGAQNVESEIVSITVSGEVRNFALPVSAITGGRQMTYNGNTVYMPTVEMMTSDNKTAHTGSWNALFPVFKNAVEITDHANGGIGADIVYNGSTTTKPAGLTVVGRDTAYTGGATSAFLYQANASNAQDRCDANYSNTLCYYGPKNLTASNTRSELSIIVMYKYTDNAGREFYYFINYHCAQQTNGGGCFTSDTLITLADGTQKRADKLGKDDLILAYDLFTGKYVGNSLSLLVDHGEDDYEVLNMIFSDGTKLRTIAEHGVFDYDLNRFVYLVPDNASEYIGHRFVKYNGNGGYDLVRLSRAFVTRERTHAFSVTSAYTSNAVASGMLTVAPPGDFYNWIPMKGKLRYDSNQFARDVETYGLYTYDDFKDYVTEAQFEAYNGAYLKIPVAKGDFTFEYILELIEMYKQYMPSE